MQNLKNDLLKRRFLLPTLVLLAIAVVSMAAFTTLQTTAAHASGVGQIQHVNCSDGNDFLELWIKDTQQPQCYAYSGEIDADFGIVTDYYTGNNVVSFTWRNSSPTTEQKWTYGTDIDMDLNQIIIH